MNTKARKNLGICMDRSSANLIDFGHGIAKSRVIDSTLTPELKQATLLTRGEHTLHQKEQRLDAKYFKTISDEILKYDDVLVFGPTDAKQELLNLLRADHRFSKIQIEVQTTDKMSEAQQEAYVRAYFLDDKRD